MLFPLEVAAQMLRLSPFNSEPHFAQYTDLVAKAVTWEIDVQCVLKQPKQEELQNKGSIFCAFP